MEWLRMGRNGGRSPSENRVGVVHMCFQWVFHHSFPCPCGVGNYVVNLLNNLVGILRGIT